jgi:Galactose oxidase-like, Early set domain
MMRAGSMTHAFNNDQRLILLDIVAKTSSYVDVKSPYTRGAAPKGDYMFFALKHNGTYGARIASVGCWTQVTN